MSETQAEMLARLKAEIEEGKRDIEERRQARLMGTGDPEWQVPPLRKHPHQRSPQAGADAVLRDIIQRQVRESESRMAALIDQKIAAALSKFADAIGEALGRREAGQLLSVRSMIHREIERAEEEQATESPPGIRRIA